MQLTRREFTSLALAFIGCTRARTTSGEEWKDASFRKPKKDDGHDKELLAEAEGNIIQYRKGAQSIRILKNGDPLPPGTKVDIKQTAHAFEWGYAGGGLLKKDAANPAIRQESDIIASVFNYTTAKCYWDERWHQPIETKQGERIYDRFLAEIDWAEAHGMKAKGHPLVWTVPKALPDWFEKLPINEQYAALKAHIQSLIGITKGRVKLWDLANEMVWEPLLEHTQNRVWPHLEPVDKIAAFLKQCLTWAREADPSGRYALNDYGLERDYRKEVSAKQQRERYVTIAKNLADMGQAPNALGTQAHVGEPYSLVEFATMLTDLDGAGLPLHITEFWSQPWGDSKEQQQDWLEYVNKILTISFGHKSLEHFTFWPHVPLFGKEDHQPTALFTTIKSQLTTTWFTHSKTYSTNENSELEINGYFGNYLVENTGKSAAFTHLPNSKNIGTINLL